MSQEFETLVRPFQTNDITPAQTYYLPGQIGIPNVVLRLGRGGSGKVLTGSYSYSATFYMTKYENMKIYVGPDGQQGSSP
jgi:hypothetical protein